MSFEKNNDEEIDAAEIEEEECVEHIKRSTIEAFEKMKNEKIRCWKLTQRKMKWRLAMRSSKITQREMVDQSSQLKILHQQIY